MEGKKHFWKRLFSRLLGNQSSREVITSFLPRYSYSVPGANSVGTRTPWNPLLENFTLGNSNLSIDPSSRNVCNQGLYVPKCLSGVDCQDVLIGMACHDDFSSACWLENHLHRFGRLCVTGESAQDHSVSNEVDNEDNDRSTGTENNSFTGHISAQMENNWSIFRNHDTNLSFDRHIPISTAPTRSSNVSFATASDITGTQYYSNELPPPPTFEAPPPYSEFPEDPPPPYRSHFSSIRTQTSLSDSTRHVLCQDIMW